MPNFSLMDDAAVPDRLHGTNFSAAEMQGSFLFSRDQAERSRMAALSSPVTQSALTAILSMLNRTQQTAFGPNASVLDRTAGHIAAAGAMHISNTFSNPSQMLWGLQNAVAGGGMSMGNPAGGMSWVGDRNTQMRVADSMLGSVMQAMPFGTNGFSNARIGQQLLPSLTQRGMFANMDVSLNSAGEISDGTKRQMEDIIESSTSTLKILGEVFGTDDITRLISETERITGTVLDSKRSIESAGTRLKGLLDTSLALGINPAAAMKFVEASGMNMAQGLMEKGMDPRGALRVGAAVSTASFEDTGLAWEQHRRASQWAAANGMWMPQKDQQQFQEEHKAQMMQAFKDPGMNEAFAAMITLQDNPNLSADQRTQLESLLSSYSGAEDKKAWAKSAKESLKGLGVDVAKVHRYNSFDDLSDDNMNAFMGKVVSGAPSMSKPIANLMKKAEGKGILNGVSDLGAVQNMVGTMMTSFNMPDQAAILQAATEGKDVTEVLRSRGLEKFLPEGMSGADFASNLGAPGIADAVRGVLAGQGRVPGVVVSRQTRADMQSKKDARAIEKATADNAPSPDDQYGVLKGILGYTPKSDTNALNWAVATGDRRLMTLDINEAGGLKLDENSAAGLMNLMSESGVSAYSALGLPYGASMKDVATAAGTHQGLASLLRASEGKALTRLGMTGLQKALTESGVGVGGDGSLSFETSEDYGNFLAKSGLLNDRSADNPFPEDKLSKEMLERPGAMKVLIEEIGKTKTGSRMMNDKKIIFAPDTVRDDAFNVLGLPTLPEDPFRDGMSTDSTTKPGQSALGGAAEAKERAGTPSPDHKVVRVTTLVVENYNPKAGAGTALG